MSIVYGLENSVLEMFCSPLHHTVFYSTRIGILLTFFRVLFVDEYEVSGLQTQGISQLF